VPFFRPLLGIRFLEPLPAAPPPEIGHRLDGFERFALKTMGLNYLLIDDYSARSFTPEENLMFEAFISPEGQLVRRDGSLVHQDFSTFKYFGTPFVLTWDGRLMIPKSDAFSMNHFHSAWGMRSRFAGEITVSNGYITLITNKSGHFKFTDEKLRAFIEFLKQNGLEFQTWTKVKPQGPKYGFQMLYLDDYLTGKIPSFEGRTFIRK
jgi:hypothetical protein